MRRDRTSYELPTLLPMIPMHLSPERFWVLRNQLYIGDDSNHLKKLTGTNWVLLRIKNIPFQVDAKNNRIPEIKEIQIQDSYKELLASFATGADKRTKERHFNAAIKAAKTSDDLITPDRDRVVDNLTQEYDSALRHFKAS